MNSEMAFSSEFSYRDMYPVLRCCYEEFMTLSVFVTDKF